MTGQDRMLDGLLFDKDGTLFDFRRSWGGCVQVLLDQIARDAGHADVLGAAIGFDRLRADFTPDSPVIAGTADDVSAALLPHLPGWTRERLEAEINTTAATAVMVPAVPLRPLLEQFRTNGLVLGVATNDSETPARAHLSAHGLTELFDFIAGYDSGHGAKPGPGMCLAFAQKTGLQPERLAMVGDSLHDLHAGRAAGMICVAVLTGVAKAEVLAPHADVVLADIGALPAWIAQRSA